MFGGAGTPFVGTSNQPAPTFNVGEAFGLEGPTAMMANMAVQSIIPSFFGNKGDIFGQFSPKIGFGEQLRRQNSYAMQQEVIQDAAKLDEGTYQKILEGISNLAGTPFGEREKKGAATMSRDMSSLMGILAQTNPELADSLHGTRGSAAVMAQRMTSAARYMQDPTTGAVGLSRESIGALTKSFHEQMFGDKADVSKMQGITAGQAGAMFDQMTRRGLLGSSMPDLEDVAKEQGKTVEELAKLPDFSAKVQQFQASRTADKLKSMTGAVAAMKDIFGENGQANAPMEQIFNALQAVTQNSLGNMNPADIERTVRDMSNSAKMSGLDMQGMMRVNAMAGQSVDRVGLDRSFAPRVATGAMTYAAAYGSQTGNMRAFGMFDKEKMLQVSANMQASALASREANESAALLRLEKTGALDTTKSPELAEYMNKLKSGERVEPMNNTKLMGLVTQAGVSREQFTAFAAQREQNQPVIAARDLGKVVGEGAFTKQARGMAAIGFVGGLRSAGLKGGDPKANRAFADSIVEDISEMSQEDLSKFVAEDYSPEYIKKIKDRYKAQTGQDMSEKQAATFLSFGAGQVSRMAAQKGYGKDVNVFNMFNKRVIEDNTLREQQVSATSVFDTAVSKFGRGTPMQRFVDTIIDSKPGQTASDFVRGVFGAVSQDQLKEALNQGLGADVTDLQNLSKRDLLKDTKILADTAGKGNLANLPKEQQDQLDEIKKTYGLTHEDLNAMKDKKQSFVGHKLNEKGNRAKAMVLDKISKNLQDTGISKVEPPVAPQPGTPPAGGAAAAPGAPAVPGAPGGVISSLVSDVFNAFSGTAPPGGGAPATPATTAVPAVPGAAGGVISSLVSDAVKAFSNLAPPGGAPPTSQTAPTATKSPLAPITEMLKSFDLGKMSTEAVKQYATGGNLLSVFSKGEKKKQEDADKAGAKVQTVRLEGGTELSGRLNIVSEEVLLKIPQTQKI